MSRYNHLNIAAQHGGMDFMRGYGVNNIESTCMLPQTLWCKICIVSRLDIAAHHGVDCMQRCGVNSIESTCKLLQTRYSVRLCYEVL